LLTEYKSQSLRLEKPDAVNDAIDKAGKISHEINAVIKEKTIGIKGREQAVPAPPIVHIVTITMMKQRYLLFQPILSSNENLEIFF